jgi:hypothetical protein
MKRLITHLIGGIAIAFCGSTAAQILESPIATNNGDWKPWVFCPPGKYAYGVKLLVQPYQGQDKDDTGVNNIALICSYPGDYTKGHEVFTVGGLLGRWGAEHNCYGRVTGMQFRSEPDQGDGDDTGLNNIRIFCNDSRDDYIQAEGNALGYWTNARHCDTQRAVCGISLQVEAPSAGDNTAVNNVRFECCSMSE